MRIHIVMHESFESPAAILTWAETNAHEVTFTRLFLKDPLPEQDAAFDFLVVMGGPQSPATTLEECAHFDARREIDFIKLAIAQNKIVLGVCLGAQLIGEALGASFEHSPNREIGVFELTLTEFGKKDPIFSTFPDRFLVGHWHGDMPGLTEDCEVLAVSAGCPRQIVRYTPRVYGFQCHFEFTAEAVEGMIENCADELESYHDLPYIQSALSLRSNRYDEMNHHLFRFLDKLAG